MIPIARRAIRFQPAGPSDMGWCIDLKKGQGLPVMKLYWVRSDEHMDDGFIIAPNKTCARWFLHEDPPSHLVWARYICDLPQVERSACAKWADVDLLRTLGYKIVHKDFPYVVWKEGELFRQGADQIDSIMYTAGKAPGVYLIQLRGEQLYKIGSTRSLKARFTHWRRAIPREIELVWFSKTEYPEEVERTIHRHYRRERYACEWFLLNKRDLGRILSFLSAARSLDYNEVFQSNGLYHLALEIGLPALSSAYTRS